MAANQLAEAPFRPSALETDELIGRKAELRRIRQAIRDRQKRSFIFYLTARGGTGKTRLLREVVARLQAEGDWYRARLLPTVPIIDLYDPGLHNPEGLVEAMAAGLQAGPKHFQEYKQAQHALEAARRDPANHNPEAVADARKALVEAFLLDYLALAKTRRLVLALDTAEMLVYESDDIQAALKVAEDPELAGLAVRRWLVERLLPQLQNTVVLLAGRPDRPRLPGDLEQITQQRPDLVYAPLDLSDFTEAETGAYFDAVAQTSRDRRRPDIAAAIQDHISPAVRRVIHHYTGGRPILLGLTIDYLVRAHEVLPDVTAPWKVARTKTAEELAGIRQSLEAHVVKLVQEAGQPEDGAIRSLGWARKGLTPDLLERIATAGPEAKLSTDEAYAVLGRIRGLSFVKERPGDDRLFPHDEMYVLLRRHVLDQCSPEERRAVLETILSYYDEALTRVEAVLARPHDEAGASHPAWQWRLRRRTLIVERLFYALRSDPRQGFLDYYKLAEEAYLSRDDDIDMQLRAELLAYWEEESRVAQQASPVPEVRGLRWLDVAADAAIRWVKRYIARARYEKAIDLTQEIRRRKAQMLPDPLAEIELDAWEAVALSYLGDQRLAEAEQLMLAAREALRQQAPADAYHQARRELVLAHVHTRLGYVHRVKGELPEAISNYQAAVPLWEKHEAEGDLANTLNNLAYAQALTGRIQAALLAVERALALRRKLGSRYAIALSLNTMGLIQTLHDQPHRAKINCEHALQIFVELQLKGEDRRGAALARHGLAEAKRRMSDLPDYDPAEKVDLLSQARRHALEALADFRAEREKPREVQTLIELGCIYRDWARLQRELGAGAPGEDSAALALQGIHHLTDAARMAGEIGSVPHLEVDAVVNLAWLNYWIGELDEALATVEQVQALIPLGYHLRPGSDHIPPPNPVGHYYVQLGKLHNLLGQIAADAGDWAAAAREFTVAVAQDLRFAESFRDLGRVKRQIQARLNDLSLVQLSAFEAATKLAEADYDLTDTYPISSMIQQMRGTTTAAFGGDAE